MKTQAFFSVFRMRGKMELQYRGAVVGGFICQVFFGLVLISLYNVLYAGHPQDVPMEITASYVWLQQAFFRMLLSSDPDLSNKIRTGDISYDLCRPLNLYAFYYARILAQKLMGSLLRGFPMILFALCLPRGWGLILPSSPSALLWGVLAMALGLCCVGAMENIVMGITMRTLDPRGMQALLNLLMMIMAGNILPLTLFPDSWQGIITLLPWAQMLDTPIRLYTGQRTASEAPGLLLIQAGWVLLLIVSGMMLWKQNQKKMVLQGG